MVLNELIQHHAWIVYTFIGLFSLAVGSLLNVVIYRLPIMLQAQWRQDCCELLQTPNTQPVTSINLFLPRSFCTHCKKSIKAWHNIPLLSYLLLRGRCAACKHKIPLRYPLIELLTLLLSIYASFHFGLVLTLPFALIAIWILIALFFIDLDEQLLPDCLTLGLLWLGLLANSLGLFTSLQDAVWSAAGAYLSLWLFVQGFYAITGKIGMANGDFKLFAAFGAWFGWFLLPMILMFASIAGAIIGLGYLKVTNQSRETTIAFGPFLAIAGIIALFWGQTIMEAYLPWLQAT